MRNRIESENLNTITFENYDKFIHADIREIVEVKIKDKELRYIITHKQFFGDFKKIWKETYIMKEYTENYHIDKKDILLDLYRKLYALSQNPRTTTGELRPYVEWACELSRLEDKIKVLENE